MKKVKFVGNVSRESIDWGSYTGDTSKLTVGKEYTLRSKNVHSFYTEYFLEELPGTFNSVWFEDVDDISDAQVFLAIAKKVPVEGQRCECWKVDKHGKLVAWSTSSVLCLAPMCSNIYAVTTANSIYMVQVVE